MMIRKVTATVIATSRYYSIYIIIEKQAAGMRNRHQETHIQVRWPSGLRRQNQGLIYLVTLWRGFESHSHHLFVDPEEITKIILPK
jgi:hypothetical protein